MSKTPRPIAIFGDDAIVPLTQGYSAIISASDIHLVDGFCWSAHVERRSDGSIKNVYAHRVTSKDAFGKQKTIMMHRVLLGFPEGYTVDHIDLNGLNNRRSNLRIASRSQNACNKEVRLDSLTGVKGVSRRRSGNFQASIALKKYRKHLGTFPTIEAAAQAYQAASDSMHRDFGRS